ncbi:hypothetical protein RRG08_030888 [Elysia crispata]|uniref:Uncharacterized protein n=1 Tax=Elysia crispata TaxID=231223 RepID=A0AAE1CLH4_9GAST|nr:hypothetical protein RRG08_030888 [Elysia crispata]
MRVRDSMYWLIQKTPGTAAEPTLVRSSRESGRRIESKQYSVVKWRSNCAKKTAATLQNPLDSRLTTGRGVMRVHIFYSCFVESAKHGQPRCKREQKASRTPNKPPILHNLLWYLLPLFVCLFDYLSRSHTFSWVLRACRARTRSPPAIEIFYQNLAAVNCIDALYINTKLVKLPRLFHSNATILY